MSSTASVFSRSGPMEYFESDDSSVSSTAPAPSASAASRPAASNAFKSEDVIFLDLKPSLAFAKFAGSVYSSSTPSLSDHNTSTVRVSRLVSANSAAPAAAPIATNFESPIDKFNRLKHEIVEFSSELEEFQRQSSSAALDGGVAQLAAALNAELREMGDKLDKMATEPRIKSLIAGDGDLADLMVAAGADKEKSGLVKEAKTQENSSAPSLTAVLAAFDRRLAAIEKSVGLPIGSAITMAPRPSGAPTAHGSKSADNSASQAIWTRLSAVFPDLHSGVMSIHRKLTLLEPQKLESISRILKSIIADFEMLDQRGSGSGSGSSSVSVAASLDPSASGSAAGVGSNPIMQQKISELYDLMGRWDGFANQLPQLIHRLQSIRVIHEQAALAVARQQDIQRQQEEIQRLLTRDQSMLERLSQEFQTNQSQIDANMKAINERMEKMAADIAALK